MNSTSILSPEEIKTAENALMILAQISADFWQNAIVSTDFVLYGQILDFERGYKDRVQKIIPTAKTRPISIAEAINFRNEYLSLANEEIKELLKDTAFVATILGKHPSSYSYYERFGFSFGGWDNDPTGSVSKALKLVGLKGYMHYGSRYRKRSICLFKDGSIRKGSHRWDELIYSTR